MGTDSDDLMGIFGNLLTGNHDYVKTIERKGESDGVEYPLVGTFDWNTKDAGWDD